MNRKFESFRQWFESINSAKNDSMRVVDLRATVTTIVSSFLLASCAFSSGAQNAPSGVAAGDSSRPAVVQAQNETAPDTTRAPYVEQIEGTLVDFRMMPIPAGSVTVDTPKGSKQVAVDPFWIGETEVRWDAYNIFVYGLDEKEATGAADAISRPSDPYVLPGKNSGRDRYPATALTRKSARNYARWLSAKTGKNYRLPTKAEWIRACRIGRAGNRDLEEHAWYQENAGGQTHPVDSLKPNAWGGYGMLGNVAEWTFTETDSTRRVVRGGSFRSEAADVSCTAALEQTSAWKATDPQLPKSQWWLSDAPFVGFRLVRDP